MSSDQLRMSGLRWVSSHSGHVPKGAVAAGLEKGSSGKEVTYVGRFSLPSDESKCVGRVVPSERTCYAISKAMEHKRTMYDVLVQTGGKSKRSLVWRADFDGHVPDTAIPFREEHNRELRPSSPWYVGRVWLGRDLLVPGVLVPRHGAVHVGHDMRELVRTEYEVLCLNTASSLRFLAAKAVRDAIRRREKHQRGLKCLKRVAQLILALERRLLQLIGKEMKVPVESVGSEKSLELPMSVVNEMLRSPRVVADVSPQLDFNTIMANCCPPEEQCCCQMWVEVTLQGLY